MYLHINCSGVDKTVSKKTGSSISHILKIGQTMNRASKAYFCRAVAREGEEVCVYVENFKMNTHSRAPLFAFYIHEGEHSQNVFRNAYIYMCVSAK